MVLLEEDLLDQEDILLLELVSQDHLEGDSSQELEEDFKEEQGFQEDLLDQEDFFLQETLG